MAANLGMKQQRQGEVAPLFRGIDLITSESFSQFQMSGQSSQMLSGSGIISAVNVCISHLLFWGNDVAGRSCYTFS